MKLSIFTTVSNPGKRQDPFREAVDCYTDLADELIIVNGSKTQKEISPLLNFLPREKRQKVRFVNHRWPDDFDLSFIGQQFQRGYDAATGDWVLRADLDYLFHEADHSEMRTAILEQDSVAISLPKQQFLVVDRFNIKSHVIAAVNKRKYGNRITFDGGPDMCQPRLDGNMIISDYTPRLRFPIWNYDFSFKDKVTIQREFTRFARAYISAYGKADWGGPDAESAFDYFMKMMRQRLGQPQMPVTFEQHPKYVKKAIEAITEEQFGYSAFGIVKRQVAA